jgi:hypothetical protein
LEDFVLDAELLALRIHAPKTLGFLRICRATHWAVSQNVAQKKTRRIGEAQWGCSRPAAVAQAIAA